MGKRRIGFYTSGECLGGLENNALQFMTWLDNDVNSISLISVKNSAILEEAQKKEIACDFIQVTKYYFSLKSTLQLSKRIKILELDVLFILRPRDILLSSICKFFFYRKLKLIYFQQSILRLKKHPILYNLLFSSFNAWLTPSEEISEKNFEMTGYNPAKTLVIPPCIDTDHFHKDIITKQAARKLLDLPPNNYIIGTIGRYDLKRHQDFLIRSAQFLKRHKYPVDVLIMGKSETKEEIEFLDFLKDLSKECDIPTQVHFREYSDKLITFLRAIDVFVVNWATEPYDLLIPKSMAAGTPVAARYSNYNSDMLGNGINGLLYEHNNLEDFTAKIIHLLSQAKLSSHLVQIGQTLVNKEYSKDIACQKIESLLCKLLTKE